MNNSTNSSTLERYFRLQERGTNVRTELLAGLTTFITMAYSLILTPQILADPYLIMGEADMAAKISNGVFIGCCLAAFIGTMLCAFYAKVPYAQAPGMGLNAFLAYTVMLGMGYSYQQGLVIVLLSGIVFIIITMLGIHEAIINCIPKSVKSAITPGIGLFITILGLKSGGVVVGNSSTLVALCDFAAWNGSAAAELDITTAIMTPLLTLIGVAILGILVAKNVTGSILIAIVATTIIGIPMGVTQLSKFDMNIAAKFADWSEVSLFKLDFAGMFADKSMADVALTVTMLVVTFSLINMFDSIGTLLGAAKQANMLDENGNALRTKESLMSGAISSVFGSMFGTPTITTMVECSAGIAAGGRTGLTSLTAGMLFLCSIILAPFISIIPAAATSPILIYVGILMMSNIKDVDFSDMTDAIPAFFTVVFMPFTYSIANGVAMGLIFHCIMKVLAGKFKEINPVTLVIAVVFLVRYAFMSM